MRTIEAGVGLAITLSGLGCAAVVEFPDDPQLVSQVALSAEPGWRCLAEPLQPSTPSAPTVRVRALACDALRGCSAPATGLTARVCSKIDIACTSPLLEGLRSTDGVFEFEVPTTVMGFDGYLEITSDAEPCTSPAFGAAGPLVCGLAPGCNPDAPDAACNVPVYPRFLHFFNPPISADATAPALITLLPTAGLLGILGATGGSYDPSTGIVIVTAHDCDGAPAADVTYALGEAAPSAAALYMDNGVLSSARSSTDATGVGGFVGLPPGYVSIDALVGSGERIGGVGVQIAPGSITNATLVPSP
jgi:hypothetical protein